MQTLEHTYAQLDHSAIRESWPKSDEAVAMAEDLHYTLTVAIPAETDAILHNVARAFGQTKAR